MKHKRGKEETNQQNPICVISNYLYKNVDNAIRDLIESQKELRQNDPLGNFINEVKNKFENEKLKFENGGLKNDI
jgi:hypothetical protein